MECEVIDRKEQINNGITYIVENLWIKDKDLFFKKSLTKDPNRVIISYRFNESLIYSEAISFINCLSVELGFSGNFNDNLKVRLDRNEFDEGYYHFEFDMKDIHESNINIVSFGECQGYEVTISGPTIKMDDRFYDSKVAMAYSDFYDLQDKIHM